MQSRFVLIVDDVEDNREMYAEMMQFRGFRVLTAGTAEDGIMLAVDALPDVIVMDIGLPGMDGLEATRRLKEDHRTRAIPIVIVTGHATRDYQRAAGEAGACAFFTKPLLPRDLVAAIDDVIRNGERSRRIDSDLPPSDAA
jgi:two-component system, cell cycle response regulator DivK